MNSPSYHKTIALLCALLGLAIPAVALIQMATAKGQPKTMSAPEAVYEYARTHGEFSPEQLRTISAGVNFAHRNFWGSSPVAPLFLLCCFSLIALSRVHFSLAS